MKKNDQMQDAVDRRTFLGQSSGVIGTSVLGSMALNHGVFAAQNDELKIALILSLIHISEPTRRS